MAELSRGLNVGREPERLPLASCYWLSAGIVELLHFGG
jgi:hypothetical protein